ncbi:MAG: response regulator [Pleurocapsa sp. MO_226.B13]|nr:response regulator [Pleurocapsa sp. MO_226.B13]
MTRILIAEDEKRLAAFVKKGLEKNGYDTAIAHDGEETLQLALSGQFDLLLLDLGLPIKDGWTVLKELEASSTPLIIIIVSANDNVSNGLAEFSDRVTDYVAKPFRFADLLARVKIGLSK